MLLITQLEILEGQHCLVFAVTAKKQTFSDKQGGDEFGKVLSQVLLCSCNRAPIGVGVSGN